jgi:hypothetical protein
MATTVIKCDEVALGNVAAYFVAFDAVSDGSKMTGAPVRSAQALQRGGGHPTSILSDIAKRQTI